MTDILVKEHVYDPAAAAADSAALLRARDEARAAWAAALARLPRTGGRRRAKRFRRRALLRAARRPRRAVRRAPASGPDPSRCSSCQSVQGPAR